MKMPIRVKEALFERAKSALAWAERQSPLNKMIGKPAINPKVTGVTKALDAKEGLVLFSLGKTDGIELQQTLDVVRDGKRISQLRVVLVKENQSVGKIGSSEEVDQINLGDTVRPFAAESSQRQ